MTRIFDKTDKGRDEIATRTHRLAPRLRTLLVLIDGKHGEDELLRQVAGLGLDEQSIAELLDNGFIEVRATGTAAPVPAAKPAAKQPAPAPAAAPSAEAPVIPPPPAATESAAPAGILPPGENQFQAIYNFYTSTIKSMIGLRGYSLQLKVERAGSIDEFRELRFAYLEAVHKAKGDETAHGLRERLDQLLFLGKPPADLHPVF